MQDLLKRLLIVLLLICSLGFVGDAHATTMDNNGLTINSCWTDGPDGMNITALANVTLTAVNKSSSSTNTLCTIWAADGVTQLASASYVGNKATFNLNLVNGTRYYIINNGTTSMCRDSGGHLPITGTNIKWNYGATNTTGTVHNRGDSYAWEIQSITTEPIVVVNALNITINSPTNLTYATSLVQMNISAIGDNLSYNCTAFANGSAIMVNQSIANNTPLTYNQNFTDGYWQLNVTCGNGTYVNTSSNVFFTVSDTIPHIQVNQPADGAHYSNASMIFNTTTTDTVYTTLACSLMLQNGYCYQESANISTSCGGLSTGTYDTPANYLYINYSKPTDAIGAIWQVEHGVIPTYNITLPDECWNAISGNVSVRILSNDTGPQGTGTSDSQPQCWNGTAWEDVGSLQHSVWHGVTFMPDVYRLTDGNWNDGKADIYWDDTGDFRQQGVAGQAGADIYEEAIWWYMNQVNQSNTSVTNNTLTSWPITLPEGNTTWNVNCTNPAGHTNSSVNITTVIDLTPPVITITQPVNGTYSSPLPVELSATDLYLDTIWFSNGTDNITYVDPAGISLGNGAFTLQVWANDTAGNVAYLDVNVTIDNSVYFTAPTLPNGSTNSTYMQILNMSSRNGSLISNGSVFVFDNINHTCYVADDQLSCWYQLYDQDYIYNKTYSIVGYANISGSIVSTNETLNFTYLGCGYLNQPDVMIADLVNPDPQYPRCMIFNASDLTMDCQGHSMASTFGHSIGYNGNPDNDTLRNCIIDDGISWIDPTDPFYIYGDNQNFSNVSYTSPTAIWLQSSCTFDENISLTNVSCPANLGCEVRLDGDLQNARIDRLQHAYLSSSQGGCPGASVTVTNSLIDMGGVNFEYNGGSWMNITFTNTTFKNSDYSAYSDLYLTSANFTNVTVYDSGYGMFLDTDFATANPTYSKDLSDIHFYNITSGLLIRANATSGGTSILNFTNLIIDGSATGAMSNYSNITQAIYIGDLFTDGRYWLNRSANQSVPAGYTLFGQVLGMSTSGYGSGETNWTWLDSQLGPINESKLVIGFRNSTGWYVINNTPDTINNQLIMDFADPWSGSDYALLEDSIKVYTDVLKPTTSGYMSSPVNISWRCYGPFSSYLSTVTVTNWTGATGPYYSSNYSNVSDSFLFSAINDGYHFFNVTCSNGTYTNTSEVMNFSTDFTAPNLTINSPTNITYNYTSILVNLTPFDNVSGVDAVWFFNGTANQTYTVPTNVTWSEGYHTLTSWANDSVGNLRSANVSFTVDSLPPAISIVSPTNKTYTTNSILVNISYSDPAINATWYYNGTANNTYSAPVTLNFPDGVWTIIAYANDSVGNINQTNATFTVDGSSPNISIISPLNQTYNYTSILLNISANDSISGINATWYNNGSNHTYTGAGNLTWPEGFHALYAWANDSAGHTSFTGVNFSVDSIAPSITLVRPQNITYTTSTIPINITASDLHLNATWYFNGTANVTYVGATTVTYPDGFWNITAYANDSYGNINSTSTVYFTVVTTYPQLTVQSPITGYYNYSNFDLNFTANSSTGLSTCWYMYNTTSTFPLPGCLNTSIGPLNDGWYNITVFVNDTAGHINRSSSQVYIDTKAPLLTMSNPKNITYTSSSVPLSISSSDLHLNTTWYFNGTANVTYTGATTLTYPDGFWNMTAFANDSYGNQNSTSTIYFSVVSHYPNLTVQFPTSGLYNYSTIDLNFTANDSSGLDSCWYMFNTTSTYALPGCNNVTLGPLNDGWYNITVFVNNTAGRINRSSSQVYIDTKAPLLTLVSPANTTYAGTVPISISASGLHLDTTWYNNGTADVIYTGATTFNFADGAHELTAYANDTYGNQNSTATIYFTVDKTAPTMAYAAYTDTSGTTRYTATTSWVAAKVTATDAISGLDLITLRLYRNGVLFNTQVSASSPISHNWTGLTPAIYTFNAIATDNAGNQQNLSTRTVTIQTVSAPVVTITYPSGSESSAYTITSRCIGTLGPFNETLYMDGTWIDSQTCANNVDCTFTYPLQDCRASTATVTCEDSIGQLATTSKVFAQVPNYATMAPANGLTITNATPLTFSMTWTCTPASSDVQLATVPVLWPMPCVGLTCSYTNSTWSPGYHLWSIRTGLSTGGYVFSPSLNFFVPSPTLNISTNITLTQNYTYTEVTDYVTGFYEDYGIYFLELLCFALAWLVTQKYPQTLIAGGIGSLFIFFVTGATGALLLAILAVVTGMCYKYIVG